jgi:hypothetical protein
MRREWRRVGLAALAVAFAHLGTVALSSAQTIYVEVGGVRTSFSASITPKALPESKRVPISARLLSRVRAQDGTHIPAIRQATIGIDRGLTIDARGVPTCGAGQLESQTTEGVEAACSAAIVGRGTAQLELALDGGAPVRADSRLLAVNGGIAGPTTTLFVHAYLSAPVTQAIVVPITLTRLTKGGYGMRAQATFPKIAGGAGSVARIDLTMRRLVATVAGGKHGYLMARCADGNLVFEPEVEFESGSRARGVLAQGCDRRR